MMRAIMAAKANCRYRLVVRSRIRASPSCELFRVPPRHVHVHVGVTVARSWSRSYHCRHPSLEYGLQVTDKVGGILER